MTTIRCSDAPIVIQCGKAAEPPQLEIDTAGPEAALGSAVHDSLEAWVGAGMIGEPDAEPWAGRYGVDPEAVAALVHAAPGLVARLPVALRDPIAEYKVESGTERGRIDLLGLDGGPSAPNVAAVVIDWKTGRDPTAGSKREQRLAYASAVEFAFGMKPSAEIYTAEIWLAADTILEDRFTLADIESYRSRLRARLDRPTARPGTHCRYCRRLHECAERDAWLRSAATALAPVDAEALTAEAIAELWDQSRALKAALDRYDKVVDALVDLTGELPLPGGRKVIRQAINRDSIDARKAWPTLLGAGLSADEINAALSVSKTKLLASIAVTAPRGKKADAKAMMMVALDTAGAISRSTTTRKRVVGPAKGEK